MPYRPRFGDFDWWLMAIVGAICMLGLLQIYSATHNGNLAGMQWKQLIWDRGGRGGNAGIHAPGLPCFAGAGPFALHHWDHRVAGCAGHGPYAVWVFLRCWAVIGGVFLQVSEVMKLIIIIVLARFFSEVRTDKLTFEDMVKAGVLVALPAVLILLEPDLGTALALLPVAGVGIYLAGMPRKYTVTVVALLLLLSPIAWHLRTHLKPYQQQRIETFLHPEESPRGAGYQILQSEIAVGSGGLWGRDLERAVRINWASSPCGIRILSSRL